MCNNTLIPKMYLRYETSNGGFENIKGLLEEDIVLCPKHIREFLEASHRHYKIRAGLIH